MVYDIDKKWKKNYFLSTMLHTEYHVNKNLAHYLVAKENEKIVAVAILHDPLYKMPEASTYLKSGFWKTMIIGGYKNIIAWYKMNQKAGNPCHERKSWFLHLLAVSSEMEGRGIGSRMLQECIIPYVVNHGGKELCLYTNSSINCRFYEKNGFVQFHEQTFEYQGKEIGSWSYKMKL